MLAVNITVSRDKTTGETINADHQVEGVQERASRWWTIPESTLRDYADEVIAVENNVIVGVFTVLLWRRDPAADNKVVFDLTPTQDWRWLIGQESPVTWSKSNTNPVRKIGEVIVAQLRSRRPRHVSADQGWSLTVDPDGQSATVSGPSPGIAVTAVHDGSVRLVTLPDPEPNR